MDNPVQLKGETVTLGRRPGMDIQLSSPKVSGQHATLLRQGPGWLLRDENSSNGTRVNGRLLLRAPGASTPVQVLMDGDVIELADQRMIWRGGALWLPAGAVLGPRLASGGGASWHVPALAALALALAVMLRGPGTTPSGVSPGASGMSGTSITPVVWGGAGSLATQVSGGVNLAPGAATVTPPATDTPGPNPTDVPTRRPTSSMPTAGPTSPTATGAGAGTTPTVVVPPYQPGGRLVLANYFAWFDNWDECSISAGDRPSQPYNSDDGGAIRRHVDQALGAGIDGFTLHWTGAGSRTDANFERLLDVSQGTGFRSTVVFEQHFFHGTQSVDQVADALRYVMNRYAAHPNFLRYGGRPVVFFVDMGRIGGHGGNRAAAAAAWADVRSRVDPRREAVWIAEGDNSALPYLGVFDGLYTYRVVHKGLPQAYLKLPRYAQQVRAQGAGLGRQMLWVATIMPGWDDERSNCMPNVRVPAPVFKRDRENGAFYRATFDTALSTVPDILYVNSFNEWVEGHYIEPSATYGDLYLNLTRGFAARYKQ